MPMINVVFLIRSLEYGGAERQLVTLAKALDKKSFNVSILCFYSGGVLEKELVDGQVKLISLGKKGRWDLLGFFWRLISHLRALHPNLMHGYLGTSNILISILKPFLSSSKIVWGIFSSNIDWSRYDWFARLTFQLERLLSRSADLIIANSSAGRSYHLRHGFPANRTIVIHTGVDAELFKPDLEGRANVRKEWGVGEDMSLIGFVGRLDPMKDHPTFLRAAAILSRSRADVRFVCVGSGPETFAHYLYALTHELNIYNRVIWAGTRSDMVAVNNAFDIASSSSYSEGISNAIEEAMACGVPCVVTDAGDSALLTGDTGIVVPPQNPEALAAGWETCLQSNLREMGQRARLRVVELFNLKGMVEQTEKAIMSTV